MPLKFWSKKSRRTADATSQLLTAGTPVGSVHETSRPVSAQGSSHSVVPIVPSADTSRAPSVAASQDLTIAVSNADTTHSWAATPPQEAQEKLWSQAYELLTKREPELANDYVKHIVHLQADDAVTDTAVLSNPDQVQSAVSGLLASREDKQWKIQLAGRNVQIREQVEKLVRLLSLSDKIIRDALSAQPYAALAWSGVSLFLPVRHQLSRFHSL